MLINFYIFFFKMWSLNYSRTYVTNRYFLGFVNLSFSIFTQVSPVFGDVDHSKMIHLLVAQGKRWKRLRTITTPAFSIANLKRVMPIVDDSIRVTMGLLEEACQRGDNVLDLHKFFVEMAFDVISRISMGQRESRQFRNDRLDLAVKCFARFGVGKIRLWQIGYYCE
jgi:cytochrome P450